MRRPLIAVDVVLKLMLVGLFAYALINRSLPQFEGKAMELRAVVYTLIALLPFLVWRLFLFRRIGYPVLISICVTIPFMLDTSGNALNFYDTVAWFDDVLHFVNWVPWAAAFGIALTYTSLGRLNIAALTVGYGAVTHILWEIGEYFAFIKVNQSELVGIYPDTIGDLALSLTGSVTAGVLAGTVLYTLARRLRADEARVE